MDTHSDEYEVIGDKVIDTSADENTRNYAQWIHLAGLIGGIAAAVSGGISLPVALLAVLILWLMKRDQSPFIDDHGKEAVNFQVSMLIYALLVWPLATLITCGLGFILIVPIAILDIVGTISGSKAAARGEYYRYPACIRLLQ